MNCATGSVDFVIGVGSNQGERQAQMGKAVSSVAQLGRLIAVSPLYESAAMGPPQPDFLNAAVRLASELPPLKLLEELLAIERAMGRVREVRWGPRTIDLDILWAEGLRLNHPHLEIPHPRLTERLFALLPLLDVAPAALDPETSRPYTEIVQRLFGSAASIRKLASSWL
jgi:2-amino-4-hydroxy-6-hydroxymethyldihydropteridine diphosphokinase